MVRYKKATAERRRQTTTDGVRPRNVYGWQDPFPDVHGTLPEKMVYAALSRLGIPFLFLNDVRARIPAIKLDQYYQADFIIPNANLIIEVQGAYWHSMEKSIISDAFKFAIYDTIGYKAVAWWDYDILEDVTRLIVNEPRLAPFIKKSTYTEKSAELKPVRRTKVDTSQGIRTINVMRTKLHKRFIGSSRRKVRKGKNRYAVSR